mmetsp:Transcript_6716/g.25183  ORF Transcript_6716/g.25183 Transcript_6716/m.25183 type:complete len:206 (-) Transcript_6716:837-1454(-)
MSLPQGLPGLALQILAQLRAAARHDLGPVLPGRDLCSGPGSGVHSAWTFAELNHVSCWAPLPVVGDVIRRHIEQPCCLPHGARCALARERRWLVLARAVLRHLLVGRASARMCNCDHCRVDHRPGHRSAWRCRTTAYFCCGFDCEPFQRRVHRHHVELHRNALRLLCQHDQCLLRSFANPRGLHGEQHAQVPGGTEPLVSTNVRL